MHERVFIGLGGNRGDSAAVLQSAVAEIAALPGTCLKAVSGLYRTPAWGGVPQPDFLNAVIEIRTASEPEALLAQLLAVERRHGRERAREQRWGPRTLDCDILLYGQRRLATPALTVPHPRMAERAFVRVPLAEIAPDLEIPGLGPLSSWPPAPENAIIERLDQGLPHVRQ